MTPYELLLAARTSTFARATMIPDFIIEGTAEGEDEEEEGEEEADEEE